MSIDVEEKISLLGLEEYISCFLVSEFIRNGYLFQMVDHGEYNINDPISYIKLKRMKEFFPDLHFLPNKQGVLVSRYKYTLGDIDTDAKLGEILGFPCKLSKNEKQIRYGYEIAIIPFKGTSTPIIAFISSDVKPLEYVQFMTGIIRDTVLENVELSSIIKDVVYSEKTLYPPQHYVNILMNENHSLTEYEVIDIQNYWYNTIGEYRIEEFRRFLNDECTMKHGVVRGLIVGLITYCDHCPLSCFFPLQSYGIGKVNSVEKKNHLWADEILCILSKYTTCHLEDVEESNYPWLHKGIERNNDGK